MFKIDGSGFLRKIYFPRWCQWVRFRPKNNTFEIYCKSITYFWNCTWWQLLRIGKNLPGGVLDTFRTFLVPPKISKIQTLHKVWSSNFSETLCDCKHSKGSKSDWFFFFQDNFDYISITPLGKFLGAELTYFVFLKLLFYYF